MRSFIRRLEFDSKPSMQSGVVSLGHPHENEIKLHQTIAKHNVVQQKSFDFHRNFSFNQKKPRLKSFFNSTKLRKNRV